MMVGELNLINTDILERFEVLELPGNQRLARREGQFLPAVDQIYPPPPLLWRGWASSLLAALDAAPGNS